MTRKRHKAEEIVNKLRQTDVELGKGSMVALMYWILGVTEVTYFRWCREYGSSRVPVKCLKGIDKFWSAFL